MKKRLILSSLTVLAIVLIVGCAPNKKDSDKEMLGTTEAVTQISTHEWKTYVSKYGFSVSYPKNWFLEEEKDAKGREEGYWPFGIYNYNSEMAINMNDEEKVEIDASILTGFEDGSQNIKDKIINVAKNRVRMSADGMRNIHLLKGEGFLFYDTPRAFGVKEKYKYYVLLLYLPRTNSVGMITIFNLGKFTIDEIFQKIKIAIEE